MSNPKKQRKTIQYFQPAGSVDEAQELLERPNLTEQDVLNFCKRKTEMEETDDHKSDPVNVAMKQPLHATTRSDFNNIENNNNYYYRHDNNHPLVKAYHDRRKQIRDLAQKMWQGEATIDEHGRLIPLPTPETQEPDLPPPLRPLPGQQANQNNNIVNDANNPGNNDPPFIIDNINDNNNNNNANLNVNNNFNNLPFPLDVEEEERLWTEQEERDAAAAIARAVERYQRQEVPTEEYVLIRVPPMERPERASLTFRRICFAVLAVVTAFLCIMLQTLPLFPREKDLGTAFDKVLYELMEVRHFEHHVVECPGLHRDPPDKVGSWTDRLPIWKLLTSSKSGWSQNIDCSQGVLNIPSKTVLVESYFESSIHKDGVLWEPHVLGVNVSWFLPCAFPDNNSTASALFADSSSTLLETGEESHLLPETNSCDAQEEQLQSQQGQCFRGIHDNMINDQEVGDTLRLGSQLIQEGYDHFDIHYDKTLLLKERLPTMIETIRRLLEETYGMKALNIQPVAFRVSAVGPLDGSGIPFQEEQSNYLLRILNRHNYAQWIKKHQRNNELARYSLAWSMRRKPFRDPCYLMSDLEADPRFAILTSVFLSNGAGRHFKGGVSLFVDDDPSNANPRRKLQKGVTVDGSRGRLVVSTGGYENRRCRLPTRYGLRAALQIWWNYDTGHNNID